jgi:hypothetical protein
VEPRLWQIVARNYEALKEHAPEGHIALVFVYFVGDPTPLPVGVVESSRSHAWLLFHSLIEGKDEPDKFYPTDRYVFAAESQLSRVEIRSCATSPSLGTRSGFAYRKRARKPRTEIVAG